MAHASVEMLSPFVERWLESSRRLSPSERTEVLRIAQGSSCKDSANATGLSPETVRARRKRIYRKLEVDGHIALMVELLARSLHLLGGGGAAKASGSEASSHEG
jgi:DNA-binding CsgD family transcriptional regulator